MHREESSHASSPDVTMRMDIGKYGDEMNSSAASRANGFNHSLNGDERESFAESANSLKLHVREGI